MKQQFLLVFLLLTSFLIAYYYHLFQNLIHIASGYAALSICSGIFLSNRSQKSVEVNELAGLTSLLIQSEVDSQNKIVYSSLFGLSNQILKFLGLKVIKSKYLNSEFGCQLILDPYQSINPVDSTPHTTTHITTTTTRSIPNNLHPQTDTLPHKHSSSTFHKDHSELNFECLYSFLDNEFTSQALQVNQTRAIVISHHGEIIYENYQSLLNITSSTPLLGWSMTKSILSILIGIAIQQNLLTLDTPLQLKSLSHEHKQYLLQRNNNQPLTFRHLLNMNDILFIEEDYSIFGPIVQFLYGVHDMTQFINQFPSQESKLIHFSSSSSSPSSSPSSPSSSSSQDYPFGWYYSSAVTNLLSYEFRSLFKSDYDYWHFPSRYLSTPLSLDSFLIEMDPAGTFIASSFGYGTARDWNKLGDLLLNDGMIRSSNSNDKEGEKRLLSSEFVKFLMTTTPLSGGYYGGHIWMNPLHATEEISSLLPATHSRRSQLKWLHESNENLPEPIPADSVFFSGYHGQYVLIIPSRDIVITRLGMTENDEKIWNPKTFFGTILHKCWKE